MATQPTLAMIPSGYKDGKLYSVLPSDGVGDFDVTRGSNATRINKDGLIETVSGNTPRLDYTDGSCPSLLLEPQSTNLVTYSEDFSQSIWQKNSTGSASAPIITSNFAISPNGNTNATRVQFNISGSTSSDKSSLQHLFQLDGSSSYTLSFYIKSNTGVNQNLSFFANSNYGNRITTTNKWIRVVQTFSSNSAFNRGFGLVSSGDVQQTVDVLIFGAQIEQKSYATSYIKSNSGSTTTRLADTANNAGNASTFNDSEGVLMVEGALLSELINDARISISDGSSVENRITFRYLDDNELSVQTGFTNGFSETVTLNSIEDYNKIALVYNSLNASIFVNGFKVATNTMSALSGLSQLQFNRFSGTANDFYGKTKQIQYYNTALTALELETLTSYTSFNAMALAQNYKIQ